jgi:hypothetical protein
VEKAMLGTASVAERESLLDQLAAQGVLVDDPVAKFPGTGRAMNKVVDSAQSRLDVWSGDITSPDFAALLIRRAESGVQVHVRYREIDKKSAELLNQATERLPNLKVEYIKTKNEFAYYKHFNAIVADDQLAYVGSAYSWAAKFESIQHTRGYEAGFLMQGASVQRFRRELESSLPPDDDAIRDHFQRVQSR